MGRTKGTNIRMIAFELLRNNAYEFTTEFKHNKAIIKEIGLCDSKIQENKLAGLLSVERRKEEKIMQEEIASRASN